MCFTERKVAACLHGGKVGTEKVTGAGEMLWEYWKLKLVARLLNIVKWGRNGPFLEGAVKDCSNTLRWHKETS